MIWLAVLSLFYIISLKDYLLFYTVVELSSVYIAYAIFFAAWESINVENRYAVIIGAGFFFIGSLDFLHTLAFNGINILPDFNANITDQFWNIARYLQGISFLIAPLIFLFPSKNRLKGDTNEFKGSSFAWNVFSVYAFFTLVCVLFIYSLKNSQSQYFEVLEIDIFGVISKYLISFVLLYSLFLLYINRKRFNENVFRLLVLAIFLTIIWEGLSGIYTKADLNLDLIIYILKLISFYFIYKAISNTEYSTQYNLFSKENSDIEKSLGRKVEVFEDMCSHIYRISGIEKHLVKKKESKKEVSFEPYNSFMQNLQGIGFQFDEDCTIIFIHGPVEEITGYKKEDILSGEVNWIDIVKPEDKPIIFEKRRKLKSNSDSIIENEYRIYRKDGEEKWVREILQKIPETSGYSGKFQGLIYDITARKMSEEAVEGIDKIRVREMHHRIKNNLQIISALLSLQAEKFEDEEVIEAFRESQNRVSSISMIHEELHEGENLDTLDFTEYLQKLTSDLFASYKVKNDNVSLKLDLEKVDIGMEIAIPLGIIVNEIISNSLKYAFSDKTDGEISLTFCKTESFFEKYGTLYSGGEIAGEGIVNERDFCYILTVKDNGNGLPDDIDFKNAKTLGLQLINVLVEQIGGVIQLRKNKGTEYVITFGSEEKEN